MNRLPAYTTRCTSSCRTSAGLGVSSYFGEIVEWAGFALACRSLPAAAFAAFTFANLGPRGAAHHAWYIQRFEDYPRRRRAVLPFLW